jgi:cytidylate kinase
MKKIIGLSGWIGSGKDTVADYLVKRRCSKYIWLGQRDAGRINSRGQETA